MHARAGRDPHQRVADVVAVAEVGDADALERSEALPDRHRVGERLQRVGRVGEAVDDRDRGVLRELVHLGLVERADQDRAQEAGEDERGVARRLPARELEVGRRHVERHPAELGDPHLGADPRPRRRLAEDEPDRAARQDPQLLRRRARSTLSSSARSSAVRSSSALQSDTRVKLRPLSVSGIPAMSRSYWRSLLPLRRPVYGRVIVTENGPGGPASVTRTARRRCPQARKREPLHGGAGPEPVRHDPTLRVDERQGVGAAAWNPQLDRHAAVVRDLERRAPAARAACCEPWSQTGEAGRRICRQ